MEGKEDIMNQTFEILGFNHIIGRLKEYASSNQAKEVIGNLAPYLSEIELQKNLRDTTQARALLEEIGTPPLPFMEHMEEYLDSAVLGNLLLPEQIEQIGFFLTAVKRLKSYLAKGKEKQIGLAFYSDNLTIHTELYTEIERSIRGGKIDDYASKALRDIRRQLRELEDKIREKAESVMRANKEYVADSYVVSRNDRLCIPVKKQYRSRIEGMEIDKSSSGATIFIEPRVVTKLCDEYAMLKLSEDEEERRILYFIMSLIADKEVELRENIRIITMLDFVFAKGKMSVDMKAVEPTINLNRYISIKGARHPLLRKEECVPLDFTIGDGTRGVIITGPNTGGKTVAIKTVALFSLMACSGLHVPAESAVIAMNNQVLCDIGDGQNIEDNLSTFSAHIKNIISILKKVNEESLVVLDELGAGTDPAEGMGIAIAILDELRKSKALFLVTTHYPEVKEYAAKYPEIVNARMAFDRESLRPLYRLEMGKAGDSCALYIAKRLGVPDTMLRQAAFAAYGEKAEPLIEELQLNNQDSALPKERVAKIVPLRIPQKEAQHGALFTRGDSVTVYPEEKIGIVVKPADKHGDVLVQIQKEKVLINHTRLKLKVAASQLYPEDYDFSIIFESVEHRKARHKMEKGYQGDLTIYTKPEVTRK